MIQTKSREGILERIKRCLKLGDKTRNPEEKEAELAIVMAKKLMALHNVSMSEVEIEEQKEEGVKEGQSKVKATIGAYERFLADVVDVLFSTKHFLRNITHNKKTMAFVGLAEDVAIAVEAYNELRKTIVRLSRAHDYQPNTRLERSFCHGVVSKLFQRSQERVKDLTPAQETKCRDLVVVKGAMIESYMDKLNLTHAKASYRPEDAAYGMGRVAGSTVSLNFRKGLR